MNPPVLHIRADSVQEALSAEAESETFALGTRHLGLDSLIERAALAEVASRGASRRFVHLGEGAQALLLHALCGEARAPLQGLARSPGLRRRLLSIFHAAGVGGLSPALFERLLQRLLRSAGAASGAGTSAESQPRLAELARLYGRYRSLLGQRYLDDALVYRRGLTQLLAALDSAWPQARAIEVRGLSEAADDGSIPLWARLHALAIVAGADPMAVREGATTPRRSLRIILPAVDGRPLLEAALAPIQEALYRLHEYDLEEVRVPAGPEDDGSDEPYPRFLRGLFLPAGAEPLLSPGELAGEHLTLLCGSDPSDEATCVARRVRDLLESGIAAGSIGVVAQSPARRARLHDALRRYGVPSALCPPLSGGLDPLHSVGQTPAVQAVLGLYALHETGVPREALIRHFTSTYLGFFLDASGPDGMPPWRVARALREAGVRDLGERPDRLRGARAKVDLGAEPEHRRRLREWLREKRRASSARPERQTGAGVAAEELIASADLSFPERHILPMVDGALRLLDGLPALAPLAGHCAALRRLCERLRLGERAADAGAPVETLARDQEAVSALLDVLGELPRAALRLSRAQEPLSRAAFADLLGEMLRQVPSRGIYGDAPSGAIAISDLGRLCARRHAHLVITGLVEGELPRRVAEDSLLLDDERRGLNRLLGGDLFPLSTTVERATPLWLYTALAHSQAATLTYALADDDGRPLLRSALVDEVLRAAALPEPQPRPRESVPALSDVRCSAELWTRAALDAYADPLVHSPGERQSAARRVKIGRALLDAIAVREPARAARVKALIAIEHQRQRFFAAREDAGVGGLRGVQTGEDQAGPFVGRLQDLALREVLQERLPGSPRRALSASALEDYARCPFRFFLRRVIKAAPMQWGGDDLDPMAGGRLHHAVLERLFKERQAKNRLPLRNDDDDRSALESAISAVVNDWEQEERMGHRALFAVRVQRLRDDLLRLIEREAREPVLPGGSPVLFEHEFGPLPIQSVTDPGGLPLSVQGVIDRVDMKVSTRADGGRVATALVLDYKAGRLDRYEGYLKHELLRTSFQLPLYAAALRADPRLQQIGMIFDRVQARYYSVRSARVSTVLDDQRMIGLGAAQSLCPDGNVAEVAYRLWRRLRDGDFRVDPQTCEGCGMEAACRVSGVEAR